MPLTRIKTKGLGTSVTFENITDTGTEGTKVATCLLYTSPSPRDCQ